MVEAFHAESIARVGGTGGIRDEGLLESALAKPINRHGYEDDVPIFGLAADYCAGIIRNHPFIDGNKRAGLLAARVFFALNGWRFEPDEAEIVTMIEGTAAGRFNEVDLAAWFEASSKKAD